MDRVLEPEWNVSVIGLAHSTLQHEHQHAVFYLTLVNCASYSGMNTSPALLSLSCCRRGSIMMQNMLCQADTLGLPTCLRLTKDVVIVFPNSDARFEVSICCARVLLAAWPVISTSHRAEKLTSHLWATRILVNYRQITCGLL